MLNFALKSFIFLSLTISFSMANPEINQENKIARLRSVDEPIITKKEEPKPEEVISNLPEDTQEFIINISKIKNLEADFTQIEQALEETQDNNNQTSKVVSGNVKLVKPNKFYWKIKAPDSEKQLYLTNGEKFWHYDENLEQVVQDDFDTQRISNSPFYFLLSESDNIINQYNISKLNSKTFKLTSKKETDLDSNYITELELKFNSESKDLENISFIVAKNKRVNISLDKIKINSKLENNDFDFKAPNGVDVIDAKEIY